MSEIITFYGADGSGKTTIAEKLSKEAGSQSTILGGSSYKDWLTSDVARETLGVNHKLNEYSSSYEDKMSLYEDIAVACYGLAKKIREQGGEVVIDSDPYLKRLIWGTLGANQDDSEKYITSFNNKMDDYLDDSVGPDVVVGVNVGVYAVDNAQLLSRLSSRDSNSSHDPTTLEQMTRLSETVEGVWTEVNLATNGLSRFNGLNRRLSSARLLSLQNSHKEVAEVHTSAATLAADIRAQI